MAKVTQGLKELQKAQLLPEADYDWRIVQVVTGMGDNNWEKVWCVMVNPTDPSLATRRVSKMIGSPDVGDWRGLAAILSAAKLLDVPDGDYGPGDTRNLEGVEFPGRLYHGMGNRGMEANIEPTIDQDWAKENLSDGQTQQRDDRGTKVRGRKTSATSKKRRGNR